MYKNICHISFDLWGTLIKSNPKFKSERAKYIFEKYNENKTLTVIESIIREVDLACNFANESFGKNIDSEEMYGLVLYKIFDGNSIVNKIDIKEMYKNIEELFFTFPPDFFSTDTFFILNEIKKKKKKTMSILSNTAFVKGESLKLLLSEILKISNCFNFQIYSDELNLSKPNPEIYSILYQEVLKNSPQLNKQSILHIGDNVLADYNGAQNFGLNAYQVNSNSKTIQDLFEVI